MIGDGIQLSRCLPCLFKALGLILSTSEVVLNVCCCLIGLFFNPCMGFQNLFKKQNKTRWYMPVISALSEWRQEHSSSSLHYIVTTLCDALNKNGPHRSLGVGGVNSLE